MKILIAEPMSPAAIDLFRKQEGWQIIVSNPKEYEPHLADCDAMVVRSAVKVKADTLAKAPNLRLIGRAGVGVDNVDLPAATAAGVLVMNTPGGNAVSVAEHTLAMMLSLARQVPAASASTLSGKWEKKKFLGNELRGKTLGVIGLGNIGQETVRRARAFEMKIIASDPYVNPQTAADLGVTLVDMEALLASSDYVSLHLAVTPETKKLINAETIAKMKDGVRIINCARGELIDLPSLRDALVSGKVAGAGLDVFDPEPPPADDPILTAPNVIASPHIGGSTEEAQEIVGIRIVEQMVEYLSTGIAINAVNMPAISPEQYRAVGPYIELAERLGKFVAYVATGNPKSIRVTYTGRISELNTRLLRNAAVAGVLSRGLAGRVNMINSMQLTGQRNIEVGEHHGAPRSASMDSIQVDFETDAGVTSATGAVIVDKPRLVAVDGIQVECPLSGRLIYLRNYDVPGVIGHVGTVLGQNNINIANFSLGREESPASADKQLRAVALVEVDGDVPETVLNQLKENPAIRLAVAVNPGE